MDLRSGGIVVVGKGEHATLRVADDPEMADRHFSIARGVSRVELLDLDSGKATLLNGRPVRVTSVYRGDGIVAGRTRFVVDGESVPERPSSGTRPEAPDVSEPAEPPEPAQAPEDRGPPLWEVVHDRSLSVATLPWEHPRDGARLTVIVKATFQISGDKVELSPHPIQVLREDVPSEVEGLVALESDLAPLKAAADVVLVGAAYAPERRPVTELAVSVRVGRVRRTIAVIGDRHWRYHRVGSPTISAPRPFTTIPLTWDRAFGGIDEPSGTYCPENPIGTGLIGTNARESVDGKRLPNLENPRRRIRSWDDRPRPIGVGFYGRGWHPRLAHAVGAGTGSDDSEAPPTFDGRFFNAAPPEMQMAGYLRGDEDIELLNVHPRRTLLAFRLPGVRPHITLSRWQAPPETWLSEHVGDDGKPTAEPPLTEKSLKPKLDTLVLLPEEDRFYLVFRAVCPLQSIDSLEVASIVVRMGDAGA